MVLARALRSRAARSRRRARRSFAVVIFRAESLKRRSIWLQARSRAVVAVPFGSRGVMQPSASTRSFRRALLGVLAVVLSVVCGIGLAAAATGERRARPAAGGAQAAAGAGRFRGRQLGPVAPLRG